MSPAAVGASADGPYIGGMAPNAEPTTRERIREVATALFYEQGYHATSMREIASVVGIKAGSLYSHYSSKEQILLEIASETMLELLDGARGVLDSVSTPAERLRELVRCHVVFHAVNRLQAKVADDQLHALSETNRSAVVEIRDSYEDIVKSVIRDGRDEAGWPVPDVAIVTFGILTMATGVGTWFRDNGRVSPERVAEIYADFVLNGLTCVHDGGAKAGGGGRGRRTVRT